MKKYFKFIFCFVLLLLSSCIENNNKKTVSITFAYENGEIIDEVLYELNTDISYPEIEKEVGYDYVWEKTINEIKNTSTGLYVICRRTEKPKVTKYLMGDDILLEYTGLYFDEVTEPSLPSYINNYVWEKELVEIDGVFYETYSIKFDTFKIHYYYNDEELDLYPNTFEYGTEVILPSYELENKEFIGWFASDISLYRYTSLDGRTNHDVKLYARFTDLTSKDLDLGEYTYLITELKSTPMSNYPNAKTYNPVIPSFAPQGATKYEWSSLTKDVVDISQYSSIRARKLGYGIIQGVYKEDNSIILKAIVKITTDGIRIASLEETSQLEFCKVTFVENDQVLMEQVVLKGHDVIPPTPVQYDGKAFNGWDHDLYNIQEDVTINATYIDGNNQYVGKKIAIIGDSISTYYGLIPDGYSVFYPYTTSNVFDFHDCWWMKVIDKLGAGLFINNSYSGSCVATNASSSSTNDNRLSKLVINGETPDVIIIYMGSNDIASASITSTMFKNAYEVMLSKIQKLCPNSEIVLCTLPTSKFYDSSEQIVYNDIIKTLGNTYQAKVVDLSDVDIKNYLVDSAHPQKEGMMLISEKIIECLLKD